jgi:hypothetical protein
MSNEAYSYPCGWLSKSTVGEHSRHVIELVQCLVNGYSNGVVCYDKRKREKEMETNPEYAAGIINKLLPLLHKPDKELLLETGFDDSGDKMVVVNSSYKREMIYNIEHAVHHLALIKVGLKEMAIDPGDETIGVAYATLQYRKTCAQ